MRIDVHTHILPEKLPNFSQNFGYDGFVHLDHHKPCCARMMKGDKFFREIQDNCWSAPRRLEDCDAANVDLQVLSTIPVLFNYWAKPKDALVVCEFLNEHIASIVHEYPRRFVGLGTVPLQEPELAARELARCMSELGLVGVEIGSHVNDWNLSDPALFPFFQAAEQLGAAVFVHPWEMMGAQEMPHYWLPWLVGMPAETSRAICSLIFGGVLERLPKLRVCFAHGGGSFPATIGRVEHGFHVRPDLVAVDNNRAPRDYLGRFYVDSLVHDAEALRYIIKLLGEDRVMLGTDYPFPLGELEPGSLIDGMTDLTVEVKEKLFSDSALSFLGLSRESFI